MILTKFNYFLLDHEWLKLTLIQSSSCGLKLLYGTERVCPDTIAALSDLAKERGALAKMKEMQACGL